MAQGNSSDDIPLHELDGPEEDEHGYVHSSRVDVAGEARRPSVPFHTRNLIRQLPSRNLDDLSPTEPDAVISEKPPGMDSVRGAASSSAGSSRRHREHWRYLTLRVRAATANNASDMNAQDLYNVLRADSHFSEAVALATLRNSKQSLTLKRSVKRRLTSSRADRGGHRTVSWWRRTKYSLAMAVERVRRGASEFVSQVDLWQAHLKDIQGNFGSGVASYFLFLRRLLVFNFCMAALLGIINRAFSLTIPRENRSALEAVANLLKECIQRPRSSDGDLEERVVLRNFIKKLGLAVTISAPTNASISADDLVKLHVRLGYVYRLSGLMTLDPDAPGTLRLDLDSSFAKRLRLVQGLSNDQREYYYSQHVFVYDDYLEGPDVDQAISSIITLERKLKAAFLDVVAETKAGTKKYARQKVQSVSLKASSDGILPDAIAGNTPYDLRDTLVYDRRILPALESAWANVSAGELHLWTSWHVLLMCGRYVDLTAASFTRRQFPEDCFEFIYGTVGPALPAVDPRVPPKAITEASAVVFSVSTLLHNDAKHWLKDHRPLDVGFPPSMNSSEAMDSYS